MPGDLTPPGAGEGLPGLGLEAVPPVGLEALVAAAGLQQRVDRKYLVPREVARDLVAGLAASHHVLEVAGRRTTQYRSTYLDGPDLRCCRDHVQRRRLRWKARSRLYVEDRLCRFEVKVRNGRGDTVKHVLDVDPRRYGSLGGTERAFLAAALGPARTRPPEDLAPTLEVTYQRATLVDLVAGTRVTLDAGVVATALARDPGAGVSAGGIGRGSVRLDPAYVVVETKGGRLPAEPDRLLRSLGHRPRSLSKYAASVALLTDSVPDNDVRALRSRQLHVTPGPREAWPA